MIYVPSLEGKVYIVNLILVVKTTATNVDLVQLVEHYDNAF